MESQKSGSVEGKDDESPADPIGRVRLGLSAKWCLSAAHFVFPRHQSLTHWFSLQFSGRNNLVCYRPDAFPLGNGELILLRIVAGSSKATVEV